MTAFQATHAFECATCPTVIRQGADCYLVEDKLACADCHARWPALTPIDGGFCVRRLDDGRCLDVLKMFYNWRLVVTERHVDQAHDGREDIAEAWCYYGHGTAEDGTPRTMGTAFTAAVAAAAVWDGTGTPPGANKRAGAEAAR
ncbi:hypothetical protein ACTD5D_32135 [Nocardia takedensis]|uniref:hypothetical protein n=1 Tax=Nocardia takedensis TaxID=259390 RepID=UPI003F768AB7